jgi:hypothetical protein
MGPLPQLRSESYESRLAGFARKVTDWRLLAAAGLSIFLLLLSVTLHWHKNYITLGITTEALLLRVQGAADLHPDAELPSENGPFLITGAARVDALPVEAVAAGGKRVEISGKGPVRLGAIHLSPEASLRLKVEPAVAVDLFLRGKGRIELDLAMGKRTLSTNDQGRDKFSATGDQPLHFVALSSNSAVPLHVRLPRSTDSPTLSFPEPVTVDLLRFGAEAPEQDVGPAFRSEILRGHLRLRDINRAVTLRPHELLRLDGLRGTVTFFAIGPGKLDLEFSGVARNLTVGGGPLEEDLTPTVFEYIMGQEQLKLLWGVFVAVFAALWGIRRWARSGDA